jgi:hypothetical protein
VLQIHERFPDNLEALRYLVQLAGDLQEQAKRAQFEAKLQKVERALAMREDIPKPASRQADRSRGSVVGGAPSGHATGQRQVPPGVEWGLGGEALLPESGPYANGQFGAPAGGGRMVATGGGGAGNKEWDEELGADLLPGLD